MTSIIARIGSGIGTFAARATGLAALGIVGYDAHVLGKLTADTYAKTKSSDRLSYATYNSAHLDTPSTVMGKIKSRILKFYLDHNILTPFESVTGYFKGAGISCINSVVPGALGIGALLGPGKIVPRLSALGLLVFGAHRVITDGFGIGKQDRLNHHYK